MGLCCCCSYSTTVFLLELQLHSATVFLLQLQLHPTTVSFAGVATTFYDCVLLELQLHSMTVLLILRPWTGKKGKRKMGSMVDRPWLGAWENIIEPSHLALQKPFLVLE